MLRLLLARTFDNGRVHSSSYPGNSIERVVIEGAGVTLHECPALLGIEIGAGLPPASEEVALTAFLPFEVFPSFFEQYVV